jgi:predicted O-linked N-acetylglucosamine transferase (SPINDLY family)
MVPLLENHDHSALEIFCYSDVRSPDVLTEALRASSDVWRETWSLDDPQLADLIREDRIDVLVDLTLHMALNRLLVFARKPAPVQVTYLGYVSTTGLETMDYRLTDPYLDAPGRGDEHYTERSIRLPETYWCYRPGIQTPDASPLPALAAGHITFGCLNNFCKATEPTLEAWCRLLHAVPNSRLILHSSQGSHRERITSFLSERRLDPARVQLVAFLPGYKYFEQYQQIDIALDPFPYGGGTTTCDALWMGVPVVTFAGETGVSRGGLSLLSNLQLPELAAHTAEEYVRIAAELARDLNRLKTLRAELRQKMQQSPIMDAPRFARNVEAAYRQMWTNWCATPGQLHVNVRED